MENNSQYKCLDYWNKRYTEEEHFEWFGEYGRFKKVINLKLSPSDRILVLGIPLLKNLFNKHLIKFLIFKAVVTVK
jgi:hypothetical protein